MWKKLIFSSVVVVFALGLSVSAGTYPGQLGVDIGLGERGGTFIDHVKEGYRWNNMAGEQVSASEVDADGWPTVDCTFIKDHRPVEEWAGSIDDPEEYRIDMSGTWKCSFIGQATLSHIEGDFTIQSQAYNSGTNTTTFDIVVNPPGPHHGLVVMSFTDTKRTPESPTNTGIANFRMTHPGYAHDTTQTFTDEFINCLTGADFGFIRFKDFLGTDGAEPIYPEQTEWSQRKLPTDASQARMDSIGKICGGSWEYVIEMTNLAGMDPWVSIPVSASTDYVTQLATMLKNNVDPSLNIYVESSNEVWNSAYPYSMQRDWNLAQGVALGIGEHENHARRTVELAQIFESVFGSGSLNDRVCVILCSHFPMVKWWVEPMLQYVNDNIGTPSNYIYGIASQLYFGGAAAHGGSRYARYTVAQLLAAAHDDITAQIDDTGSDESGRIQWVAKAAAWNLVGGYCSYEGGPDYGGGDTTNLDNRILCNRDPGMATEYKYNLDDAFFGLGANLATQFTMTSGYNRYGCWGLTDDVTNPDRNYKFQAARDLLGGEPGPPGQATNPDPGNGETGVSTTADLSWTAGSGTESHDVYFGTATSPPFIQNQPETTYSPDTMAENTTYFWRIDEVNAYGTTTGVLWNFTTGGAGCVPSTMHVDSITVTAPMTAPPNSIGRAEVVIVDNCGDPVSGALVSGTFTGDINESGSDTTDDNGLAVIETVGTAKRPSSLTFCVDSVTDTLTYNEADNVETCDSL